MRISHLVVALCVLGIGSSICFGASATYVLQADGGQEFPGPGDPDGTAAGRISLDDVTGQVSWEFTYQNIATPTAMHIHGPMGSAGQSAGVHIALNVTTTGGAGTLVNSLTHGTLQDITDVLGDPTDYYVNIHNGEFGPGAVRGQLGTAPPSIPTLTEWGVILLALLVLTSGLWVIFRRRELAG